MEKRFSPSALIYERRFVGPHYPQELTAFDQAYAASAYTVKDDRLLNAAFALNVSSDFTFARKGTWQYTITSDGTESIRWEKVLHFITLTGGNVLLFVPHRVGIDLVPQFDAAILTGLNDRPISNEVLSQFAREYSQRYVDQADR